MKRIITYAAIILAISCQQTVDPFENMSNLLGSWKFTNLTRTACTNTASNGSFKCPGSFTLCTTITFGQTDFVKDADFGLNTGSIGTYSVSGTNLIITQTGQSPTTYTFSVVGNTLTFSYTGGTSTLPGCTFTWTYVKV